MPRIRNTIEYVLALCTRKPNGCLEWSGYDHGGGYGRLRCPDGKRRLVHRYVYECLVGPIPDEMPLDHLCRNPRCVEPTHVIPVTPRENALSGIGPTAINAAKRQCIRGHDLDGENLIIDHRGGRQCRICLNDHSRRWRARNPERRKQICSRYYQAQLKWQRRAWNRFE